MHTVVIALLLSVPVLDGALAAVQPMQDKPAEGSKEPKRGDTLVVRGCITGGMIESSDADATDSTGTYRGLVTYRLTGDKKALKQIKREHDGHVDIVTGKLKSNLPQQNTPRGKRVGNTRITVGIGAQPTNDPTAPQYLPALEVKDLEHTSVTCRR